MLLAIDISNSTIKAGVFQEEELITFWQIATERHKAVDDYGMLFLNLFRSESIEPNSISGVSISCVVPRLRSVFKSFAMKYLKIDPFIVDANATKSIRLGHDIPSEVGGDRIVNAEATHLIYGGPAIAIAFGTATVFDCVSEDGVYLGGAIAPGLVGAMDSVTERTAQLTKVELLKPPKAIAKNSIHAIQSGMVFGFTGLVEKLITLCKEEMLLQGHQDKKVTVIATGGLAEVIEPETNMIDIVDQRLTLKGLRLLFNQNKN